MTPLEVREDHPLMKSIDCRHCTRTRMLRVGAIPRRWQAIEMGLIPFRCGDCGEPPDRIQVERGWGPQYERVWEWRSGEVAPTAGF